MGLGQAYRRRFQGASYQSISAYALTTVLGNE